MTQGPPVDEIVRHFKVLLVGRTDAYLEEKRGCVKELLTDEVIVDHLRGRRRIGAYSLLTYDGKTFAKFSAIDIDGKNLPGGREEALDQANRAMQALEDLGIPSYLEQSRSGVGFHVWVFFGSNRVPLGLAQNLGQLVLKLADLPSATEIFPKGEPGNQYGGTPFAPLWGFLRG